MNPICNILVIVDPTAEQHVGVMKAALLAERLDARLELFICDTKASRATRLAAHVKMHPNEPFQVNLKSMLEALAAPLRERGLDVTTETDCADPLHAALIERTRRTTAELVVKDTHHHSIARRTFVTNADWHLIRDCPVSLLLTKTKQWKAMPRVFAAVDPGHANDKPGLLDHRILEHASLLGNRLGGELHVVHAYVPVAAIAATMASAPPMVAAVSAADLAIEREAVLTAVKTLVAEYGVDSARIHVEAGGPVDLIPRIAGDLGADIVVMGAISRSGAGRAYVGSTAEAVLEHIPCDELIVKPPDFADLLPF